MNIGHAGRAFEPFKDTFDGVPVAFYVLLRPQFVPIGKSRSHFLESRFRDRRSIWPTSICGHKIHDIDTIIIGS